MRRTIWKRNTRAKRYLCYEIFSASGHVVVLGDPGSGKTTIAKYLIVKVVDQSPDLKGPWKGRLPIRVPLREYAEYRERSLGVGASILDFIRAFAKTELQLSDVPDGFFEFYFENRQAFLILDGLDEIFNLHLREQVKSDIISFTQVIYPRNLVLVTSRIVGYEEASFSDTEFSHLGILPFSDPQVSEYVEKWYRLEESDRKRREQEISAFAQAKKNLPRELLSNPLLLSLIVILFRAGCTLPESRLEIYRSCVGTLVEKWDAAGKRLALPPEYNLVSDKQGAFAHIAYWMHVSLSKKIDGQSMLRYSEILKELGSYLSRREFKGKEEDAYKAAQSFLDYAAKRSVFVEDRFSHKTFQEYFAALHLFRNFCVGRPVEDLYGEIQPYLGSDYWAVVLELLFQMLDEHGSSVVGSIFERIVHEVHDHIHNYWMLLMPLTIVSQLRNVEREAAESLIATAVRLCTSAKISCSWSPRIDEEVPHQRVFAALEKVANRWRQVIKKELQSLAGASHASERLVAIATFCAEYSRDDELRVDEIIAGWEEVRHEVARMNLGIFYLAYDSDPLDQILDRFVSYFGVNRISQYCACAFRSRVIYGPVAYRLRYLISKQQNVRSYGDKLREIVSSKYCENVLEVLLREDIRRESVRFWQNNYPLQHILSIQNDTRSYLFDFLMSLTYSSGKDRPRLVKRISELLRRGSLPQRYYASLMLGVEPPKVTRAELGLSLRLFELLQQCARRRYSASLHVRRKTPVKRRRRGRQAASL